MTLMSRKHALVGMSIAILLSAGSTAQAQSPVAPWSVEFGIGFDNGISGNINSSAVGQINNQVVVITRNSYEDVYGTGLQIRFGGGYMIRENTEIRVTFTFQSLDADFVVPMGDIGVSNLYAQYTDYQTFGMDVGLRRYYRVTPRLHVYGDGTIGLGFIDKTDVTLVAPGANLSNKVNDFYDQTAAFALGANAGVMFQTGPRFDVFAQLGLRWMSGMAEIDQFEATGLNDINNKSSRWTLPLLIGVRYRF